VRLLQAYESANYKKVEQWLHGRYKWKQTEAKNEWFNLTDDEVMNFLDECKKADTTIQFLLKEKMKSIKQQNYSQQTALISKRLPIKS
jgi:hypothetical protein